MLTAAPRVATLHPRHTPPQPLPRHESAVLTYVQKRDRAPSGDETRGVRYLVDGDGTRWRVYEQAFADYDRRRGLSLIFSSDGAVRRVRNYPDTWRSLSDDDLLALSWSA